MKFKGVIGICCGVLMLGSTFITSFADSTSSETINTSENNINESEDINDAARSDWAWMWNATSNVNLRASYSTSASVKTVINKGEKVYSLSISGPVKNGFMNVRVKRNGSWVYGWASANYFKWSSDNEIHPVNTSKYEK